MPPMDDASSVDPNMQGGMDPNMGADPNMMGDPNMQGAPDMGNVPDMGNDAQQEQGSSDDTVSLFNKLSDDDKEAARSYIESMLDKEGSEKESEEPQPQMPTESVIFTKKQVNKLNEEFGIQNLSKEKETNQKKMDSVKNKTKNSPFSSPSFE